MRVWKALTCLPDYDTDIKGRVLLDLMNEPDGVEIAWGSNELSPYSPLEDYYLGAMDAIHKHSPAEAVFMIEVGFVQGAAGLITLRDFTFVTLKLSRCKLVRGSMV